MHWKQCLEKVFVSLSNTKCLIHTNPHTHTHHSFTLTSIHSYSILSLRQHTQTNIYTWEPWSCGYGRRLMFWRSWIQIPVQYTGWTFFTLNCCKKWNVCLEKSLCFLEHFNGFYFNLKVTIFAFCCTETAIQGFALLMPSNAVTFRSRSSTFCVLLRFDAANKLMSLAFVCKKGSIERIRLHS